MSNTHGKCSHHYCGHCMIKNEEVDITKEGCDNFLKFNAYEYRSYVKKYKGVINE